MTTIDKETSNKVNFMTFIITKFARAYKMNSQQAYLYLKKYGELHDQAKTMAERIARWSHRPILYIKHMRSTCR